MQAIVTRKKSIHWTANRQQTVVQCFSAQTVAWADLYPIAVRTSDVRLLSEIFCCVLYGISKLSGSILNNHMEGNLCLLIYLWNVFNLMLLQISERVINQLQPGYPDAGETSRALEWTMDPCPPTPQKVIPPANPRRRPAGWMSTLTWSAEICALTDWFLYNRNSSQRIIDLATYAMEDCRQFWHWSAGNFYKLKDLQQIDHVFICSRIKELLLSSPFLPYFC